MATESSSRRCGSVPHLGGDRRQIVVAVGRRVVAAIHHRRPRARWTRSEPLNWPRARVAEGRHPRETTRGCSCIKASSPSPSPSSSPLGVDSSRTSALATRARNARGLPLVQIEHDRALAEVVLPEEEGALGIPVLVEGPDAAGGAAAGRLDLDDVGAQAGQRQPASSACSSASSITRMPVRQVPACARPVLAWCQSTSFFPVMVSGDYQAGTRPAVEVGTGLAGALPRSGRARDNIIGVTLLVTAMTASRRSAQNPDAQPRDTV